MLHANIHILTFIVRQDHFHIQESENTRWLSTDTPIGILYYKLLCTLHDVVNNNTKLWV